MKSGDDIKIEALYSNLLEEAKKKKESKKKVNPWAIAKSMAKKKGLSAKKEEEIVKGIKKGAKKTGAKITAGPIEEAFEGEEDIFEKYENVGKSADMGMDELLSYISEDILKAEQQDQEALKEEVKNLWMERIQNWNLSDWNNTVSL